MTTTTTLAREGYAMTTQERSELMASEVHALYGQPWTVAELDNHLIEIFRRHLDAERADADRIMTSLAERVKGQAELLARQAMKSSTAIAAREEYAEMLRREREAPDADHEHELGGEG